MLSSWVYRAGAQGEVKAAPVLQPRYCAQKAVWRQPMSTIRETVSVLKGLGLVTSDLRM